MKEQILIIMSEVFELDILDFPNEVNQEQIDNWDSLRHLNLIVELEEAFDVSFEPEEISEMISIEKIEQVIMEKYHDK
ncbi:acyl carrier protein [Flavobacterium sp.]|jgi:acyl carrier protein|uniref:acyl carrier protein n=1 Tax=Flavobacterium sp. TaxID=239 RepID=UPI0037BEE3EB